MALRATLRKVLIELSNFTPRRVKAVIELKICTVGDCKLLQFPFSYVIEDISYRRLRLVLDP